MERKIDSRKYEKIINMPHHVSDRYPRMSMNDRAAQFSSFAALTGHDAVLAETARLTDSKIELNEDEKAVINKKLQIIENNILSQWDIEITYFRPDELKSGGAYLSCKGKVKKIDHYKGTIVMWNETVIPINDIVSIECEMFDMDENF